MKGLNEPANLLYRCVVGIVAIRRDILDDNLNSSLARSCVVPITKGLGLPGIYSLSINAVGKNMHTAIHKQRGSAANSTEGQACCNEGSHGDRHPSHGY